MISPLHAARLLILAARMSGTLRGLGDVAGHEFHGNQWTQGSALPRTKDGEISVDMILGNASVPFHAYADEGEKEVNLGRKSVAIASLIPTQKEGVSEKTVSRYVKDDDGKIPIDVYQRDGKTYVADGHHRVVAAILRGDTTIQADVTSIVKEHRALGDVEGHDFHGNQWTAGGGERSSDWFSSLIQLSGAKGSNPGGVHKDVTGQKWYVKQYSDPRQGASEHVANEIYKAVGINASSSVLGPKGEFATRWIDDAGNTLGHVGLTKQNANAVLDGFAADVFVANWDAVGTGHDNILVKGDQARRVDQGGTLLFRAQGGLKPENGLKKIGEWDSLASPSMNAYYSHVFKVAGVKNADALGSRVVKQIDRIVAARPKDGWESFVKRVAPHAGDAFHKTVGEMLEARQAGLVEKAAALRVKTLGEFDEEKHPRDSHGKFTGGDGNSEIKGKKGPKAPPVPMDLKHKAYEMIKSGKTFKAVAAELGMTHGQVAGHVWKVDQKKKAIEEAGKATATVTVTPVATPVVETTSAVGASKSEPTESGSKAQAVYNNKIKMWDVVKDGNVISSHVFKADALDAAHVHNTLAPKIVVSKTWSTMNDQERMALATDKGYTWKEKTFGPKSGQYAWFDKSGTQVSAPFADKTSHREALGTLHNGKGLETPVPAKPTEGWPIGNDVPRQLGSNYANVVEKASKTWASNLSPSERAAIKSYTGSYSEDMNSVLRGEVKSPASDVNGKIAALKLALSKSPTPPPPELVWRGISKEYHNTEVRLAGSSTKRFVSGLAAGDKIELDGFQSTSIRPAFAASWSNKQTIFEIKPAKGAYVRPLSNHDSEYEYILPHAATYTVKGITTVDLDHYKGVKVVQLEMHP